VIRVNISCVRVLVWCVALFPFLGAVSFAGGSQNVKVDGIFFDDPRSIVMIGGTEYRVGDSVCGGKITAISPADFTVQFHNGAKVFKTTDSLCSKALAGISWEYMQEMRGYFVLVSPVVKDFLNQQRKSQAAANAQEKRPIGEHMLQALEGYKQNIRAIDAPQACTKHRIVTLKMLDIATRGWRLFIDGDAVHAELFFRRAARLSQELNAESFRILP